MTDLLDSKSLDDIIAERTYMEVEGEALLPPPPIPEHNENAFGVFDLDAQGILYDCIYWSTPEWDFVRIIWGPSPGQIRIQTFCLSPDLTSMHNVPT